jgi:cytochrome oxidase Cu insertion factor (SCO1/SenC/PrrC family)
MGAMRVRLLIVGMAGLLLAGAVVLSAGGLDGSLLERLRLIPVAPGVPPPLALTRLHDGRTLSLADLRGQPVLVYFWASW